MAKKFLYYKSCRHMMLPSDCRLLPHIIDGRLYSYGGNHAYCADPATLYIIETRPCEFPHRKHFNTYLTQPIFHNGAYYASYMDRIYLVERLELKVIGKLSANVLRNCLISNGTLLFLHDSPVVIDADMPITVLQQRGIFFSCNYYYYKFDVKTLYFLTPSLDLFEQQHVGQLLCYGSGFAWFWSNGRLDMLDLMDMERTAVSLSCQALEGNALEQYWAGGVCFFQADPAYMYKKQSIAKIKQSHFQQLNSSIAAISGYNQRLIQKFQYIDKLWSEIDVKYQQLNVGSEVHKREVEDLKADLDEEIDALTRRIAHLKEEFKGKLQRERTTRGDAK